MMENMGSYYNAKHNVDFRSIRYPGVISPYEFISNGSTDYASEIFFAAHRRNDYSICLSKERTLPMTYLEDIIEGTIKLMLAENDKLRSRVYNIQGLSFSCEELALEVQKNYSGFRYNYKPDFRDIIARTWPQSLDDSMARKDWNWDPVCMDVQKLIENMKSDMRFL